MSEDLEPQAAARVGQLVFAFARMDYLLALALRNILFARNPGELNPLIERLGFKERMDLLRDVVRQSGVIPAAGVSEFDSWYQRADQLRSTRNAFVHGRWGMQTRDTVFNASTKVGKQLSGESKFFSLEELDREVALAKQVLNEFHAWHGRYVASAA